MSNMTGNYCPHCGNTVYIDNDKSSGMCWSCGYFVQNSGYRGKTNSGNGCLTTVLGLLIIVFVFGVNLISCFVF